MNQILNDSTLSDDYKSRQFSNLLLDFLFFKYGSSVGESTTTTDTGGRAAATTTPTSEFAGNNPTPGQREIFTPQKATAGTPQKRSRRSTLSTPSPATALTPKTAPATLGIIGGRSRSPKTSTNTPGDRGITTSLMSELLITIPHPLQRQGRRFLQFLFAQKDFLVDGATGEVRLGPTKPRGPFAEYFEDIFNPARTSPDLRARILLQELIKKVGNVTKLPFNINPVLLEKVRHSNKRRRAIIPSTSTRLSLADDADPHEDDENNDLDNSSFGKELADQSFFSSPSFSQPSDSSFELTPSQVREYNNLNNRNSDYVTRRGWKNV